MKQNHKMREALYKVEVVNRPGRTDKSIVRRVSRKRDTPRMKHPIEQSLSSDRYFWTSPNFPKLVRGCVLAYSLTVQSRHRKI